VLAIALLVGGLAVVGGSPAQAATCPASTGSVAAAWSAIRSHGTVGATALRTERPRHSQRSWVRGRCSSPSPCSGSTPKDGSGWPRTRGLVVSGEGPEPLVRAKQGRAQLSLSRPTALPAHGPSRRPR